MLACYLLSRRLGILNRRLLFVVLLFLVVLVACRLSLLLLVACCLLLLFAVCCLLFVVSRRRGIWNPHPPVLVHLENASLFARPPGTNASLKNGPAGKGPGSYHPAPAALYNVDVKLLGAKLPCDLLLRQLLD